MADSKSALISTIRPAGGGVPAMVKAVVDFLRQRDYIVTLAYYEPYSVSPQCSVPAHRLLVRRPSTIDSEYYGCRSVGIGCYLPELEFTHYRVNQYWRELIAQHDVHFAVSGSCLAALPFVKTATPFLAWIASDWQGDREHRVEQFPWYRRIIDSTFISLMTKRLEKQIIESKCLVALSEHTQAELNNRAGFTAVEDVLPMPIDVARLTPAPRVLSPWRIGFVGRFEDPRKNISLLIRSFAKMVKRLPQLELVLIGDELSQSNQKLAQELNVSDNIIVHCYLNGDQLLKATRSINVFVLPSHQEGLCIAALEAMSCGIPVVSTRCGGPETYIEHSKNGLLVNSSSDAMADAVLQLLSDSDALSLCGKNARDTVIQRFSKSALSDVFWSMFEQRFGPH